MEVEARQTKYVKVHVSRRRVLEQIMKDMEHAIRPTVVAGYDDWFINYKGEVIGVTEYHHGSDGHAKLGKADKRIADLYAAIRLVRKSFDVLPEDD